MSKLLNEIKNMIHQELNEIRKGDYVDSMGEVGLVNKVKGQVAYVKFPSKPGSFHPILASSLKKAGKHKGKDLYSEGKLNENVRMPAKDWINIRLVQMLLKSGDLKKYKSVLQKAQGQDGKKAIDMIYKKIVLPLHKAMKIDPTKVKDLRSYIAKYGEDKFTDAWNKLYKQGVSGSYLYALAGTIFQGMERYDYVSKPLGLTEASTPSLPSEVKRYMEKFLSAIKGANLNRQKQKVLLAGLIEALGIDSGELMMLVNKIKKGLKTEDKEEQDEVGLQMPFVMVSSVDEAAPKMKTDKKVEQLKTVRQIASGVEAQIKTGDSSRYSHVKNDFNKFRKAIDNLISALNRKGSTIPENVNEATSLWKHFDAKMKLQDTIMDLEYDMKMINKDLSQLHKDMEQEAEPEGGPKATRYGREIEKKEKEYKKKKAEFKKLMAKLDRMEQY